MPMEIQDTFMCIREIIQPCLFFASVKEYVKGGKVNDRGRRGRGVCVWGEKGVGERAGEALHTASEGGRGEQTQCHECRFEHKYFPASKIHFAQSQIRTLDTGLWKHVTSQLFLRSSGFFTFFHYYEVIHIRDIFHVCLSGQDSLPDLELDIFYFKNIKRLKLFYI